MRGVLGIESTTNHDLEAVGRGLFGHDWGGVLMDGQKLGKQGSYFITNTDSPGGPGTHWVSIYRAPGERAIHLYDSFGRESRNLLKNTVRRYPHHRDADYDVEQADAEKDCGQRCLAWLLTVEEIGIEGALKV